MLFTIKQLINGLNANITKRFADPEVPKSSETSSSKPDVSPRSTEQIHPTVEAREEAEQLGREITPPKPSESPAPQAKVTIETPEQKQAEKTNRRKAFVEDLKKKGGMFSKEGFKALLIGEAFKWLGEVEANEGKENLGFFDKLGNWVKKLFGGAILKWLGYDLDKEEKEVNGSVGSKTQKPGETKIENNNEVIKSIKYTSAINLLYKIRGSGKDDDKFIPSILIQNNTIENKTFNQLRGIYDKYKGRKPEGIGKELGFNPKLEDSKIFVSIEFLINNENFITQLKNGDTKWKDLCIIDSLTELGNDVNYMYEISQKVDNIKEVSLEKMEGIINSTLDIGVGKDGEINFGSFSGKEEILTRNLSKNTIYNMISTPTDEFEGYAKGEKEKEFIEKTLLPYRKNITSNLSGLFGGEFTSKYKEYFDKNPLNSKNLLVLYMITGGKTNLDEMNSIEKTGIYLSLLKIVNNDELKGETIRKIIDDESSKIHIPEEVKETIGIIFRKLIEKTLSGLERTLSLIWGFLTPTEIALISGILVLALVAMWYARPLKTAIITGATFSIVSVLLSNVEIKERGYKREELEKKIKEGLNLS